jgi:hypothetical protein
MNIYIMPYTLNTAPPSVDMNFPSFYQCFQSLMKKYEGNTHSFKLIFKLMFLIKKVRFLL